MKQIDWAQYAEIAYVNFGWSPNEFWQATPTVFWCAYREWHKIRSGLFDQTQPLGRKELNQLVSQLNKS